MPPELLAPAGTFGLPGPPGGELGGELQPTSENRKTLRRSEERADKKM